MLQPTIAEMLQHEDSARDLLWRAARHPELANHRGEVRLQSDLAAIFAWASSKRRAAGQPFMRFEQIHHALRLGQLDLFPNDLVAEALEPMGELVYAKSPLQVQEPEARNDLNGLPTE